MLIPSEIGYKNLTGVRNNQRADDRDLTSKNSKSKSSKTTTIAKRKSSEEENSPLTKTLTRLEKFENFRVLRLIKTNVDR